MRAIMQGLQARGGGYSETDEEETRVVVFVWGNKTMQEAKTRCGSTIDNWLAIYLLTQLLKRSDSCSEEVEKRCNLAQKQCS